MLLGRQVVGRIVAALPACVVVVRWQYHRVLPGQGEDFDPRIVIRQPTFDMVNM